MLRAMLNYLWAAFFLIAFVAAFVFDRTGLVPDALKNTVTALFDSSKTAFEISIGLTGVMTLWLGLMRVAEKGGVTDLIARLVGPLFRRLFPDIPAGHPASGAIVMNRSANMLGLDNAATPLGLKAMKELQGLNKTPEVASDAMVLFMVMNASSVTLVPISIMTFRQQLGAANPADVFVPILIATYISDLFGLLLVASIQRINLFNRVVLGWLGGLTALMGGLVWHFSQLTTDQVAVQSGLLANVVLVTLIGSFIVAGLVRRIPVYETFVEGAKEGFQTAVGIIPYLVAMLVAVGALRASGVLDMLLNAIKSGVASFAMDTRWVDAMPTALIKPLSGGGARGMMVETMKTLGADSFAGRLSCVIQGSTETTFYVLAVYFGSVAIRQTRHAIIAGLTADFVAVIASVPAPETT